MRILICTSELPYPPITGTRLTLLEVLRRVAPANDVTLVGYRWPEQHVTDLPDGITLHSLPAPRRSMFTRAGGWLGGFRTNAPMQTLGMVTPIVSVLDTILAENSFDVAHVTASPIAGIAGRLGDLPKIMVSLDAWHLNARSQTAASPSLLKPLRRLEESRIEHFQRAAFRAYDCVVTVSAEDAAELVRLGANDYVSVIPNGVDTQLFYPDWTQMEDDLIVFVGTMRWAPNITAARYLCQRILPIVRRERPNARAAIVGRAVPDRTRKELESYPGVTVVGEVPDVSAWLRRAAVFCCPMVDGTGIKNKLLEALACGVPTVATKLACQGIRLCGESQLLVGESAVELAGCVVRLLDDRAYAIRLGQAGRAHVERFYRWDAVAAAYDALYRQVAERNTQ